VRVCVCVCGRAVSSCVGARVKLVCERSKTSEKQSVHSCVYLHGACLQSSLKLCVNFVHERCEDIISGLCVLWCVFVCGVCVQPVAVGFRYFVLCT